MESMGSKIIETVWLFWAFNHKGINDAILGSTLLDLEQLLKADLDSMTYLFLVNGIGAVGGSTLSGCLSRCSLHLQMALHLLVGCAVTMAIPQMPQLPYVYVMVLVYGVTKGAVESHVIQACSLLWTEKGTPFQFVIMGSSVGSILVPLLARPFLAARNEETNHTSPIESLETQTETHFLSNGSLLHGSVLFGFDSGIVTYGPTHIGWAYLLIGLIILPSGLAQLYYWFKKRKSDFHDTLPYAQMTSDKNIRLTSVILVVCLLVMFLLIGASSTFQMSMVEVYGVQSPLHMRKSSMMLVVSLISVGSLLMRVLSSIALRFIRISTVLKMSVLGEVVGVVFLVLSASMNNPVCLIIATFMLGGFAGPLAGAVLARISEFIPLNAAIISSSFVAASLGIIVFPFLGGLLLSIYGPKMYIYVNLVIVLGHCLVLLLIEVFGRIHGDLNT